MDAEYQSEHLKFVSGHNGSDPLEILLVGAPVHCSQLLLISMSQLSSWSYSSSWSGQLLEWVVMLVPTTLSLTILSSYTLQISLYLLALAIVFLVTAQMQNKTNKSSHNLPVNKKSIFVSNHRALMIIFTTVGILAVDFPVFPRKFAKTETFGYGWMDLGVGSYAFVNGLLSPEARQVPSSLKKNLLGCVPLVLLGLIRLISVTMLGYHENVTEYGVHWNFFFSLAAVRLLSSLIQLMMTRTKTLWVTSLVIAVLYEGFLTFGLASWILSPDTPRDGVIEANREGLASSLGYLAIYLAGVSWGREIFQLNNSLSEMFVMLRLLMLWSLVMWISLIYSLTFFLPPSRRLANYTFFTWILAYNLTVLLIFLITDLFVIQINSKPRQKPKNMKSKSNPPDPVTNQSDSKMYRCPEIVKAVDFNPLLFFLAANLMTGVVNMTVETIKTDDVQAVIIIIAYQAVLAVIVKLLYKFNIKMKFW